MAGLIPPDEICFEYANGKLVYEEVIYLENLPEHDVGEVEQRTRAGFEALGADFEDVTVNRDGDEMHVSYTVERSREDALGVGALELMLAMMGAGEDPDRVWHLAKALGPQEPVEIGSDQEIHQRRTK